MCWHRFLTRVKEGDFVKERLPIWKKPKGAQDQNWPMKMQPMGQKEFHEDADLRSLVIDWWSVADESEGRKGSSNSMRVVTTQVLGDKNKFFVLI